jgi:hypothetical protein
MTDELPHDDIPEQIVPMILYRMRDYLEVALMNEVPDSNPTRAVLVKVGRFQENPIEKNVSVAISSGDYEDPSYMDGRIDHEELDQIVVRYLPVGEIGGGIYWWRRGTAYFHTYFIRERYEEDTAIQYAYDFYGRFLRAFSEVPVGAMQDDYGEKSYGRPYIEGATYFEGGGNRQFIFRGKLRWRVLTWRP